MDRRIDLTSLIRERVDVDGVAESTSMRSWPRSTSTASSSAWISRFSPVSVGLPPAARSIQGTRAGLISRLPAAGIDLAVVSLAAGGAIVASSVWRYFFSGGPTLTLRWPSQSGLASLGGALLVLYLAWGWGRTGRTIGKRVLGLALVTSSGGRVSWFVAATRAILYVAFPLGLLWSGTSRTNRSVQDMLLGTAVVDDWRGARRAGIAWHGTGCI